MYLLDNYLLDTNVISELRLCAKGKGNPHVMAWAKTCDDRQFHTSVVVLMEIERGILRKHRKDKQQGELLKNWFENTVQPTFFGRTFHVEEDTASICASLHIPNPAPMNDAWIAATAIQHNLTLVTRNTRDFDWIDNLSLLNPFNPPNASV